MKATTIIITLLVIISVGLTIAYVDVKNENDFLKQNPKNFRYEWSESQESLGSYWRNNNKLASMNIDQNFDNNFEIVHNFDIYGNLMQTGYDKNENGVYERCIFFDLDGKKIGTNIDDNENGNFEEFSLILDSGKELIFYDINEDARYEKLVLKYNKESTEILLEDLFKK